MNKHPQEVALESLAYELGLSTPQVRLLRNLMGWDNRDGTVPESGKGLTGRLLATRMMRSPEAEGKNRLNAQIHSLLRLLVGDEFVQTISTSKNPRSELSSHFNFNADEADWILLELKIQKDDPSYIHSVAPELQFRRFVIPAISKILQRKAQELQRQTNQP